MTAEPVAVYNGRTKLGAIVSKAGGFEAKDAAGRKLGAFTTQKAAARAVAEADRPKPAKH